MIICSKEELMVGSVYGDGYELNPYRPSPIDLKNQPLYIRRQVTIDVYAHYQKERGVPVIVDDTYFFYEVSTD